MVAAMLYQNLQHPQPNWSSGYVGVKSKGYRQFQCHMLDDEFFIDF